MIEIVFDDWTSPSGGRDARVRSPVFVVRDPDGDMRVTVLLSGTALSILAVDLGINPDEADDSPVIDRALLRFGVTKTEQAIRDGVFATGRPTVAENVFV